MNYSPMAMVIDGCPHMMSVYRIGHIIYPLEALSPGTILMFNTAADA